MSQRSHIASSGSTAICECSAACSEPSSSSQRELVAEQARCVELVPERLRGERRRAAGRAPEVDHLVVGQALALVGEHRAR